MFLVNRRQWLRRMSLATFVFSNKPFARSLQLHSILEPPLNSPITETSGCNASTRVSPEFIAPPSGTEFANTRVIDWPYRQRETCLSFFCSEESDLELLNLFLGPLFGTVDVRTTRHLQRPGEWIREVTYSNQGKPVLALNSSDDLFNCDLVLPQSISVVYNFLGAA